MDLKKETYIYIFSSQVIRDYTTPPNEELSRDLVNRLKPYIRYQKFTSFSCVSLLVYLY